MEPKLILMSYHGQDDETAAFETALNLVLSYKAHLDVWQILPSPLDVMVPYASFGMNAPYIPQQVIEDLAEANKEAMRNAKEKYRAILQRFNIPDIETPPVNGAPSASFRAVTGHEGRTIAIQARVSDLVILARLSKDDDTFISDTVQNAIFESGRPVLLIPPGKAAKKQSGNILIAWNGSAEAAHAVMAALPYLKNKSVRIITQQVEGGKEPPLMPSDLAHYLKRHGIKAESGVCWNKDMALPNCIIDAARFDDADMIVMGAYSHSRLRELVLGGVTEYMLNHAEYPVFLMH
jgi:nucleotide-binding universal stress UspA family protein